MSELSSTPAELVASEVGLTIAAISDLDELLPTIAQRVAEALDVWECDVYEYRADTETLVARALWAREMDDRDRAWLGTEYALADRPSYRRLMAERGVREFHADDPDLGSGEIAMLQGWGEKSILSVPLVFRDEVIGALTLVEKRAVRKFTPDEVHLLELLAVPAAVAVHSARMLRREALQNRRLHALLSASRAMSSAVTLDELLAAIAREAGQALDTDECAINIYDAASNSMTIAAYYQRRQLEDPSEWLGRQYSLDEYPADFAHLQSRRVTEELLSDPGLDEANREEMVANGERTHLSVPLVLEGEPYGMLVFIELDLERHFTDEEVEVALALGEQAAAAIHKAELLRRAEAQNRQLELLLESTRAVSSSMDFEAVLQTVARTTAQALGAEQCQIQEYDAAACTITPVAFWQRRGDRPEPASMHQVFSLEDEPEEREFLEAKRVVQQLYSDPAVAQTTRDVMDKYGDLAYLNIPLVSNDQSFGVLVLVETDFERRWTDDEVKLAQALGEQAAVAIENARLYKKVQAQALTDGLTGLYNHRYFYERLDQEIARARRYGTPVSLLMIDLDEFKAFNDKHGHPAGDAVLRIMATVLESELRRNLDIAARYGGEEFAVILPNTPMEAVGDGQMEMDLAGKLKPGDESEPPAPGHGDGAGAVAERIRQRVEETRFEAAEGTFVSGLTVSIGVAVFPQRTDSPEDLVANADAALYKAKRAGKNKVETYG